MYYCIVTHLILVGRVVVKLHVSLCVVAGILLNSYAKMLTKAEAQTVVLQRFPAAAVRYRIRGIDDRPSYLYV